MITDTHVHLFWKSFEADREEVIARARAAGVRRMIVVGTDVPTSLQAKELARSELELHATAGIHPHDAQGASPDDYAVIEGLCREPECVAVGETGLDFFKNHSGRNEQFENFHWHLDLARRLDKPVIVHCRDAHRETAEALEQFPGVRGVMHCYTFGEKELAPFLEAGFYISFSGVVTYPRNDENRAAAAAVPVDRLLVETDCPFLSPQGHRGKRNEPAHVREVLATVAQVRGADLGGLARQTSDNAARLFGLAPLLPDPEDA